LRRAAAVCRIRARWRAAPERPRTRLLQVGIGLAVGLGTASAIILPDNKQKDAASMEMYGTSFKELNPQQAKAAEFRAGHARWKNFVEKGIYPITRALPGSNNPIVNPFRNAPQVEPEADE
jgi:hypothetical protein